MLAAAEGCYRTRRQRDSTPPQHHWLRAVFEPEPQQPLPAKVAGCCNGACKAAEQGKEASRLAVVCSLGGRGGRGWRAEGKGQRWGVPAEQEWEKEGSCRSAWLRALQQKAVSSATEAARDRYEKHTLW